MYFPRIRDMREDHELHQKEIAATLGINQRVYSRYESGLRTIPVYHLIKLADYYNTSTDFLLGRTNITEPYARKK